MKKLLTSTLVLKVVDPNKDFIVCTNACIEGMGGVLMQEGNVIFYESWKLKDHENNYETHDLELQVVVHALKVWRHYIMDKKFEI